MKELSQITETFTESVIREMTRICNKEGGYNLSQGFPDFGSPEVVKKAAIKAINDEYNQYPVTYGEPELREAISIKEKNYNDIVCDPETDITVTCGATEAMISTLKALINPGDEIIIFEPFYENYGPDSILSGASPRYVTLKAPHWNYSLDELKTAFNEKTKAIIINTPNNPTGKVFTENELKEIANLCQEWDVYAISDEIYEHILYDGTEHVSIASIPGMKERTITINSISKTYSVTGWRVGWAIADEKITRRIRKVHDFLTVGAPTPFQHATVKALSLPRKYYDNLQDHYLQARNFLVQVLNEVGFKAFKPRGSYYIITDTSSTMEKMNVSNDFAFSRKLIKKAGVATVPGSSFYSRQDKGINQVRFTFCKKWSTLKDVKEGLYNYFLN